jgi:hypothetical protein
MTFQSEARDALYGSWRLACLDRGGLAYFGRDEGAFWRSFIAAAFLYPAFLVPLLLGLSDQEWQQGDLLHFGLVETLGYVIDWVGFPQILLPIARYLGREPRWLSLVVVYNWSQILQKGVFLGALGIAGSGVLTDIAGIWLVQAAFLATLVYEWFVVRVALDVEWLPAVMIVLADLVFSILITGIAAHFH